MTLTKVLCFSITAMAQLFLSGDARLQNVVVKGDLIQNSDSECSSAEYEFLDRTNCLGL